MGALQPCQSLTHCAPFGFSFHLCSFLWETSVKLHVSNAMQATLLLRGSRNMLMYYQNITFYATLWRLDSKPFIIIRNSKTTENKSTYFIAFVANFDSLNYLNLAGWYAFISCCLWSTRKDKSSLYPLVRQQKFMESLTTL